MYPKYDMEGKYRIFMERLNPSLEPIELWRFSTMSEAKKYVRIQGEKYPICKEILSIKEVKK